MTVESISTSSTCEIDKFDEYYDNVFISITCSGTASLEIAKRNIPQIVIYKLNYFTELILKFFVKVKYACLLNIISKKMIIPEIVNSNLNNKKLINTFKNLETFDGDMSRLFTSDFSSSIDMSSDPLSNFFIPPEGTDLSSLYNSDLDGESVDQLMIMTQKIFVED